MNEELESEIPETNIKLLSIADGFFILVEPEKDRSTIYHIDSELND